MANGRYFVGTSGWSYGHWIGPFYPQDADRAGLLRLYSQRFDTVEINNTFYRLPSQDAVERWRRETPVGFVFACKASRFITHMKKLKDPAASVKRFFEVVEALGRKRGPILFQLPPRWGADPKRLGSFLAALPPRLRYAFEFRDESWWNSAVYDVLALHNAAFCAFDLDRRRSPVPLTADFAYVRLHGPDGPYRGRYDGRTLAAWARRIETWLAQGRDIYCYFDNDEAGYAPLDALRLREMLERSGGDAARCAG